MTNSKELDKRVEELETKITFQDDLIEQLNQSIITQQQDIRRLTLLIERLNSQIEDIRQPDIADASQETPPPHY